MAAPSLQWRHSEFAGSCLSDFFRPSPTSTFPFSLACFAASAVVTVSVAASQTLHTIVLSASAFAFLRSPMNQHFPLALMLPHHTTPAPLREAPSPNPGIFNRKAFSCIHQVHSRLGRNCLTYDGMVQVYTVHTKQERFDTSSPLPLQVAPSPNPGISIPKSFTSLHQVNSRLVLRAKTFDLRCYGASIYRAHRTGTFRHLGTYVFPAPIIFLVPCHGVACMYS